MNEFEKTECSKLADDVTRYAWGELAQDLRPAVEAHVKGCTSCTELVSFVKEFISAARQNAGRPTSPDEPHPDASLIVDLEADELDEETARQVSMHLLDCKPCREAYLLLRSLSNDQFEERVLATDFWQELIQEGASSFISGRKAHGGTIVALFPGLLQNRGISFKVFEISAEENTYRVTLSISPEGAVSCDIKGTRTPLEIPLNVSASLADSGEQISTKTDTLGNGHLVVRGALLLIFDFSLKDRQQPSLEFEDLTKIIGASASELVRRKISRRIAQKKKDK